MVIAHNLTAMNVARNFSVSSGRNEKSTEKLSSGYRINRAADDAAGLSISEKMRRLVRGLKQASANVQDGVSLLQTADGALEQTQDIIQRINELSVKAANGTCTESDRDAIQQEIGQLISEIDRIAASTEFNTRKLLDGSLQDGAAAFAGTSCIQDNPDFYETRWSACVSEVFEDYTTSLVPMGGSTAAGHAKLAEQLEKQIVPQIVNSILDKYSAFSYLDGTYLGIGLRIYDENSSTLAYVSSGYRTAAGGDIKGSKEYQLGVNLRHLSFEADGSLTADSRQNLEATIAHEMIHAFMAEATTNGMLGGDRFPLWFVEGMAQTSSGDGGWVSSLSSSSSDGDIRSLLARIGSGYSSGDGLANYGSGYLADMYLGYMAGSGGTMEARITDGLNKIMSDVINGTSLNDAIAGHTTYSGLADFGNNVQNDADAYQFVRELMGRIGAGRGGLVSGDLTDTDLAADSELPDIPLFILYPNNEKVNNIFEGDYVILSGGGATTSGSPPGTPAGGMPPPAPPPPPPPASSGGLWIQAGAESGDAVRISIAGATADDLDLRNLSLATMDGARAAIDACTVALERVSQNRSSIGAYQNRLEHAMANLNNTEENTQAAESLIRDTDMAEEMLEYSCGNIIVQAMQSILAQTAQSSQGVLSLLT